jgi:hypothetical protein
MREVRLRREEAARLTLAAPTGTARFTRHSSLAHQRQEISCQRTFGIVSGYLIGIGYIDPGEPVHKPKEHFPREDFTAMEANRLAQQGFGSE